MAEVSRDAAWDLVTEWVESDSLRKHLLGVEAAMHLGVIRPPGDEPPPVDLESARHLIDMLGILQSKTSGNLTPEEDRFLDGVLADLRMSFVEISRGR